MAPSSLTPKPQLITLEQETPIEGITKGDDGREYMWHKWLCAGDKYFMASPSLDGMLKMIPDKLGKVIKIEKVVNPKPGGYPFFQVNGMNRDQLIAQANIDVKVDTLEAIMPNTIPSQPPVTDGALDRLEQKVDRLITMVEERVIKALEAEKLPF